MEKKLIEMWRQGGKARERLVGELAKEGALTWARKLYKGAREERRLAATLLGRAEEVEQALEVLRVLAVDDDRYTRDAAVESVGLLLSRDLGRALLALSDWRRDGAKVRKCALMALASSVDPVHWERADPILRFIDPMVDEAPGDPTLGSLLTQLVEAWPEETFEHLAAWSTGHDERVLTRVAQVLGRCGPRASRKALIVLRRLALDERKLVRTAVINALSSLARADSEVVLSELRRWLPDEDRAPVARAALSHI